MPQIKQRLYHLYQLCTPTLPQIFEHRNKKNKKINTILVYFFKTLHHLPNCLIFAPIVANLLGVNNP